MCGDVESPWRALRMSGAVEFLVVVQVEDEGSPVWFPNSSRCEWFLVDGFVRA